MTVITFPSPVWWRITLNREIREIEVSQEWHVAVIVIMRMSVIWVDRCGTFVRAESYFWRHKT